ncbi:MAG: Segregation and condensation protein [Planctomycetota bacterium]|jgi:segregation and condensation protein B
MAPDDDSPDFDPLHGNHESPELTADLDDIELAYRQALQALDAAEEQMGSVLVEFAESSTATQDELQAPSGLSIGAQLADELRETAAQTEASSQTVLVEGVRRVTPREVVEAALFVGGPVALTARRLATLIGQNVDNRVAVSLIDSINQSWARENRPYEIQLQEGGYRLELREEFADVSTRTFGLGPRDIKLSPETLEVLAFVAWNQPITTDSLKSINKPNAPGVLRQLLRLQLVEIQRTGNRRSDVSYVTTARFLKLFGLKSLADLPTADIFSFK